jgi:hypothetical protein
MDLMRCKLSKRPQHGSTTANHSRQAALFHLSN